MFQWWHIVAPNKQQISKAPFREVTAHHHGVDKRRQIDGQRVVHRSWAMFG